MDKALLFTAKQLCLQASDAAQKALDILELLGAGNQVIDCYFQSGNSLPPEEPKPILCSCGNSVIICRCTRGYYPNE